MFKKFLEKFKSSKEVKKLETAPLSSSIIEQIFSVVGARSIPPMPSAAQKAFRLSINPKAEARDFIEVIESDESLSARIIRVSNSVYFDRGKKSNSIADAVGIIGLNELKSLLNASSLATLFPSTHPSRTLAWNNDICTALYSRYLAEQFLPEEKDQAFLCGMMHDIGKLLLIQRANEEYSKIISKVESNGVPFHIAESETYLFDHTEVGQLVGEKWGFTPELLKVVRYHHHPFSFFNGLSLEGIIKSADILAYITGSGGKNAAKLRVFYQENINEVWQYLGISFLEGSELLKVLERLYETESDIYRNQK